MLKLMDKKIIAILRKLFLLNWPYDEYQIRMSWLIFALLHENLLSFQSNNKGTNQLVHP